MKWTPRKNRESPNEVSYGESEKEKPCAADNRGTVAFVIHQRCLSREVHQTPEQAELRLREENREFRREWEKSHTLLR
ncbi:MAG: hypothetical protein KC588_08950 [Nitrospira sp.]|nr:hypothetical protein [Nitrospira sp.]